MNSNEPRFFKKEARRVRKVGTGIFVLVAVFSLILLLAMGQALAKPEMSPDKVTCTPCHNDGRKGDGKGGIAAPAAPAKSASKAAEADKAEAKAPAKSAPKAAPKTNTSVSIKAFGKTTSVDGKASGKTLLVPLRKAADLFFAALDWDAKSKTVTVLYSGKTATLQVNKNNAAVDGKEITLDAKAQIIGGATYVPLSFISQVFGGEATGDTTSGFALNAAAPGYVGSQTCAKCHDGTYKNWQTTRHSRMFQDAKADNAWIISDFRTNTYFKKEDVVFTVGNGLEGGQRYVGAQNGKLVYLPATWDNKSRGWLKAEPRDYACGQCHNTGYNPKSNTWAENSISCEACHGPGAEHAKTADKTKIKVSLGNEMCSSCHGADRQAGQLESMGHTDHFKNGMDGKLGNYADTCVKCHSATAYTAVRRGQTPPKLEDFKTGALKDDRMGITCVVCHGPHKNTGNPNQLRKPLTETCTQCHTNGGPLVAGKAPHHPQKEFFEGKAIGINASSPMNATCAECHMADGNHYFKPATPTVTLKSHGKPYEANPCKECHSTMTAAELKGKQDAIASKADTYQKSLKAIKTKLDAAKAAGKDTASAQALYDANFTNLALLVEDKSKGVHNPAAAKAILAKAETDLAKLATLLP